MGNFPRTHNIADFRKDSVQNGSWVEQDPEEFEDRIIFMTMFNDIYITKKRKFKKMSFRIPKKVKNYAKNVSGLARRSRNNGMEGRPGNLTDDGI